MILLSSVGERHEDRIPEGIFTSLDEVRIWIRENYNFSFMETNIEKTDYDESATMLYLYDDDQNESDVDKCYFEFLFAEKFDINNQVIESSSKEKSELEKLLGFK